MLCVSKRLANIGKAEIQKVAAPGTNVACLLPRVAHPCFFSSLDKVSSHLGPSSSSSKTLLISVPQRVRSGISKTSMPTERRKQMALSLRGFASGGKGLPGPTDIIYDPENKTVLRHSYDLFNEITKGPFEKDFKEIEQYANDIHASRQPPADAPEITINWMDTEGKLIKRKHKVGQNLLHAAQDADMDLPAICNGAGDDERDYGEGPACSTCHVYIASKYLPIVEKNFPPSDRENSQMYWVSNSTANSRLACTIKLEQEMDGMTIAIPEFPEFDHGDPRYSVEQEVRYLKPEDQVLEEEIEYQEHREFLEREGLDDTHREINIVTAKTLQALHKRV